MREREAVVMGELAADAEGPPAITGVAVELRGIELVAHWKRCGLTADWLAGFLSYDFDRDTRARAANVLATVINELVENAAKFCADKQAKVAISVRHHGDFVRIETRHLVDDGRADKLRAALAALDGDLDALFAERIEHQTEPGASGIGLVILKKDHAARIGVHLVPDRAGMWDALVQVSLDVEAIGGLA